MADAGSSAYDLDAASQGATDIADAIFVGDRALADIGNDFHIRMGVKAEAGPWSDFVVVPDHECAEWAIRAITAGPDDKVVTRLQPAMIALIERFFGSKLQHDPSATVDWIAPVRSVDICPKRLPD
jgi:hypothetical protein